MTAKAQPTWVEKPLNAPHHYNMELLKVFYRCYRLSLFLFKNSPQTKPAIATGPSAKPKTTAPQPLQKSKTPEN
jgi:hypothetical protein